jgi:predicted amidohydrolase YtcJ
VLILNFIGCKNELKYDLVINNGWVLDLDSGTFVQQNLAIKDGKIIAMSNEKFSAHSEIDASGQYVYPGFIDAHCHFWGYASGLLAVDLVGTNSFEEVVERTKMFANEHPDLTFISGRGWDQNDWDNSEFPTKDSLDKWFPEIPVFLMRIDGHAALVNSRALQLADSLPEILPGGRVIYAQGEPTGLLIDNAVNLIPQPVLDKVAMRDALLKAEENCFAVGLTGLADAGLDKPSIDALVDYYEEGDLRMPLYVMIRDNPADYSWFLQNGSIKTDRLSVRSIKVYGDGALGSRGALLLKPYADDPLNYGLMLKNEKDLKALCKLAYDAHFQVNVHAIGDSANRLVLQAFSSILPPQNDARWRIEHAQVVNPLDSIYFQDYKVIPSVQPTHATSDMYWVQERLGEERVKHAYTFNSLLNWRGVLPLGTDFPVEDIDPLRTLYAAVTRQDSLGFPNEGFLPSEKLSRIDALKGMTIWAAYAQFEENEKGSIQTGKWADFVLLPVDLLKCPAEDILQTQVLKTIVHGEVVYTRLNQ